MTFQGCGIIFRRARRLSVPGLCLIAVSALSACASATIEDAVPQSAASGAVDTGTYPNLNIVPVAETTQLTPEERARMTAELQAAQARLMTRNVSARSGGRSLEQIGETHAEEALRQIEE